MLDSTKNTLFLSLSQLTSVLFAFITGVILARYLGPFDRGIYAILILFTSVGIPILSMGLVSSLPYFLSKNIYKISEILLSIVFLIFISLLIIVTVYILFYKNSFFPSLTLSLSFDVFTLFIFAVVFYTINFWFDRVLIGNGEFIKSSFVNIIKVIIILFSNLYFVVFQLGGIYGAILSLLVSYFIISLILCLLVFKKISSFKLNKLFLKDVLRKGISIWPGDLSNRLNFKLDQILLGIFF